MNKSTLLLIIFSFICAASQAQFDSTHTEIPLAKKCIVIEPTFRIGKIVKNYPTFPERGPAQLYEINISQQCSGNKKWHQLYGYPSVGVAVIWTVMGNNNVLGQNFALLPNIAFTSKKYRRWSFQYKVAMGFAFFTKKYDPVTNPENRLIGSTMTNMALGGVDFRYDLSKHFTLMIGLAGIHFSDAHYQLPNLGANFPAVNIGLKYFPYGRPILFRHDSIPDPDKKILFNLRLGIGFHEFGDPVKPTAGPKYPIYTASFYLSKRYGKKNNVHLGIHINYHTSFYDFIVNQEVYSSNQRIHAFTGQIFIGHEFMMGHFGLITQIGIYFYNPFFKKLQELEGGKNNFNTWVKRYNSNKLGVQYYFLNAMKTTRFNPYIGIYLKANFGQADFAEFSAGCAF